MLRALLRRVNSVLCELQRALGTTRVLGLPKTFAIETLMACNLRCPFCQTGRGEQPLSRDLFPPAEFLRLLDRCGNALRRLAMFRVGEPLLHPCLPEMIEAAGRRGIATSFHTNLNHFSPELARRLVSSGVGAVTVAIDGATQASYARYRKGGRLLTVFRHVRWIQREKIRQGKSSPRLLWQFIVFRHNEVEIPLARAMAKRLGMDFKLKIGSGADGWLSNDPRYNKDAWRQSVRENDYCGGLWRGPQIHSDGSVFPCCVLRDPQDAFGNVFSEGLGAVWNNARFRAARAVVSGRASDGTAVPCSTCAYHPARLAHLESKYAAEGAPA